MLKKSSFQSATESNNGKKRQTIESEQSGVEWSEEWSVECRMKRFMTGLMTIEIN